MHITLLSTRDEIGSRSLTATINGGRLKISGQDLFHNRENPFGADEYEYGYSFDSHNTESLLSLIAEDGIGADAAILSNFSGEDGERKMRELCEANEIKYEFFSRFD